MKDCIFCQIIRGEAHSWKIMDNDHAYAFLDINPVNPYHALVIPKIHAQDIFDISQSSLKEVIGLVHEVAALYKQRLGIDQVQIVNSNGPQAQQDVFHIHYHIVPRRLGDGQNIRWKTHPELRDKFDGMLEELFS